MKPRRRGSGPVRAPAPGIQRPPSHPSLQRASVGALEALLLLRGALGPRNCLEALGRNRLPALDREAVAAVLEPLLRAPDRLQLGSQLLGDSVVDLLFLDRPAVVDQVRVGVDLVDLAAAHLPQIAERGLDPLALALQQLARMGLVDRRLGIAHLLISCLSIWSIGG